VSSLPRWVEKPLSRAIPSSTFMVARSVAFGWPLRCVAGYDSTCYDSGVKTERRWWYLDFATGYSLPTCPVAFGLLADSAVFAFAWGACRVVASFLMWDRRERRGRCPVCGYDMLFDWSRECAECGRRSSGRAAANVRLRIWSAMRWAGLASIAILGALWIASDWWSLSWNGPWSSVGVKRGVIIGASTSREYANHAPAGWHIVRSGPEFLWWFSWGHRTTDRWVQVPVWVFIAVPSLSLIAFKRAVARWRRRSIPVRLDDPQTLGPGAQSREPTPR
jgi:hypothetical protein